MRRYIAPILFATVISFFSGRLAAQNQVMDSLFAALKLSKEDSNKVHLLHCISFGFLDEGEFDKALKHQNESLELAEKLGIKIKIAMAYQNLGHINYTKNSFGEALKNYYDAVKIEEEIGDEKGKANSLNNIGNIYRRQGKYAEARENYNTSLKLWEKLNYNVGIAMSYHNIGNIYRDQGNYPEALKNFFASLKMKEKIGNKYAMLSTYYVIGSTYGQMGNYSESLKNHVAALELSKEIGDKREIAGTTGIIGNMYNNQGNYSEALKYYFMAMNIQLEIGNKHMLGTTYNNIGSVYIGQARMETDSLKKREYLNEALKYLKLDLEISEELDDRSAIGFIYGNIGSAYAQMGKYEEALQNHFASLKIRKEIGDKRPLMNSYISIGNIYSQMKDYENAKKFLNEGLDLALQTRMKDITREIFRSIQKIDSTTGNWSEAYRNYRLYNLYSDSLINDENARKSMRVQMQYDYDKKEDSLRYEQSLTDERLKQQTLLTQRQEQALLVSNKENELQNLMFLKTQADLQVEQANRMEKEKELTIANQEKSLQNTQLNLQKTQLDLKENQIQAERKQRLFYIGGGVLMLLLFVFIYRNIRNRQRTEKLVAAERLKSEKASAAHKMAELELQSLRAQLNPHFMFNSLNAIQELILKEDNDNSHLYLSRFSDLLRMLLENANQPFVSLRKEISLLEIYLSLENLRVPDLKYSIEVDPLIDSNKVIIPNMMLQPYIENAIWHGLSHKKGEKNVCIRIGKNETGIVCEVEDNGVGRKMATELRSLYRKEHRSRGMELLSKRFSLLSKEYGSDIHTNIEDLHDNGTATGTRVSITVPFSLTEKPEPVFS